MASSPTAHDYLSIRNSCDRCRSQKVKCIPKSSAEGPNRQNGSIACERCCRAMVSCTFSRRNNYKRKNHVSDSDRGQAGRETAGVGCASDGLGTTTMCYSANGLTDEENMMAKDPLMIEADFFPLEHGWMDSSMHEAMDFSGISSPRRAMIDEHKTIETTFHGPTNNRPIFTTNGMGFPSQGPGEQTLTDFAFPAASFDNSGNTSNDNPTALAQHSGHPDRGAAMKMLLSLLSNLQDKLETLENGPWQRDSACQSLDSYPIGSVLQLTREFALIATTLRTTPSTCFDMTATHLLLACYSTLSQIHSIILGHFQNRLHLQPSIGERASRANMSFDSTMLLGDLPCINMLYSQVHTAICALLNSLGEAEEAMGLSPQIRPADDLPSAADCSPVTKNGDGNDARQRELAITPVRWGLLKDATYIEEELRVLTEKVTDIKRTLRKKMAL
ncbi:GAL4 [Aspergillus sp. HF37]|nr:GAL4 [Aspergillus sp. HF37]